MHQPHTLLIPFAPSFFPPLHPVSFSLPEMVCNTTPHVRVHDKYSNSYTFIFTRAD